MPTLIRCMIEEFYRRADDGAPESELLHTARRIRRELRYERNEA